MQQGIKFDRGKDRWDLLPLGLVQQVVRVFTFGAEKYTENSWQKLSNGYDRYKAALFRHIVAHEQGQLNDPESGLPHLAHAAWNALVLLHFGCELGESRSTPIRLRYTTRTAANLLRALRCIRMGKKMRLREQNQNGRTQEPS